LGRDTLLCKVSSYSLSTAAQDSAFYTWNVSTANVPSVTVNTSGLVWVKVQNKCGTALDSVNVRFETAPRVSLPKDTLLCNVSSFAVLANTGGNNDTFFWNTGSRANPLNITADGVYWVQVANVCGTARDSILLAFNESPQTSLPGDEDFCDVMSSRTLNATSTKGKGNIYSWNTGEGTPVINANNPGTFAVKVNNVCGEAADSVRYRVFVSPQPQLPADTSFCGPFQLPLSVQTQPGWSVSWDNGSNASAINATQPGAYRVNVRTPQGCTGSDDMNIFNSCDTRIYVPTAFTPSVSIGTNDVFKPYVKEVEHYDFRIFDRWGQLVFATMNPEEGWDGTFKGRLLPEGVYAWSLYYYGGYYRGNMKGTVHLLR
jgi:gliding motility-associated-like protein